MARRHASAVSDVAIIRIQCDRAGRFHVQRPPSSLHNALIQTAGRIEAQISFRQRSSITSRHIAAVRRAGRLDVRNPVTIHSIVRMTMRPADSAAMSLVQFAAADFEHTSRSAANAAPSAPAPQRLSSANMRILAAASWITRVSCQPIVLSPHNS
jgi:hypothetical protein